MDHVCGMSVLQGEGDKMEPVRETKKEQREKSKGVKYTMSCRTSKEIISMRRDRSSVLYSTHLSSSMRTQSVLHGSHWCVRIHRLTRIDFTDIGRVCDCLSRSFVR